MTHCTSQNFIDPEYLKSCAQRISHDKAMASGPGALKVGAL